ncbi:hypothetical protein [Micromonospora sp. KC606]|uniref:hypothetical protein n=1 Tax=Micromonospora sp. KC606 TaxID=2530379 RepID=UPI001FB6588B|nr:hypothetical protein [Micromonospora sp. KC606]
MGIRIRLATGLLLAATAGGVVVGLAPAAGASPVGGATSAAPATTWSDWGLVEGPFSSDEEGFEACKVRAQYWYEETRVSHFCRYKDGSDGVAAGWWVWMYK